MQKRLPLGIAWQLMAYHSDTGSGYGEIMQSQKQDSTQLKTSQVFWDVWYKSEKRNEPTDRERQGAKESILTGTIAACCVDVRVFVYTKSEGDALE